MALVRGPYPRARTVVVDADHQMHSASPEVIVDAIDEMIAAQRE